MSRIEKPVLVLGCLTAIPFLLFVFSCVPLLSTTGGLFALALFVTIRSFSRSREQAESESDQKGE